jgi:hypothetical protein
MLNNATGVYRRWRRRAITVIGLGVTMAVAVAAPAFGHPVFSNNAPGFPNPQGSATSPYPAGSHPTLNMFLPFEQDGVVFNGAENTTVDVQVTIPAGWTSPACGAASTSVGNQQVGTAVPPWTCAIETVSGHQVLHWHGPQVSPSQANADSAQFFTFQATVPSPATTTSYGAIGGPEGFYVKQVYANGASSLWRVPNSTRVGEVANGLVRTVASITAPLPTPAGGMPTGTKPTGAKATGPPPPPLQQGGGGPAPSSPAGEPPHTVPPTAPGPPSAAAQGSAAPTSAEPSPGVEPPSSSAAEQLAQQRDDATGHGVRWQVLVGIVLGAVIVVGSVIAVVKRRRRSS